MSNSAPARRPYGLPSNPRQSSSLTLKHARSQPDISRQPPLPSSVYEPLPASRASTSTSRPREQQPMASTSRSHLPSRSLKSSAPRVFASPTRSDSALPPAGSSLRRTNKMDINSSRTRSSFDDAPRMIEPDVISAEPQLPLAPVDDGGAEDGPLWKKMATILTINVSKALAATINDADGEATPMGAESRLTKAMKKYHLEKARDHNDLPDWLFNENERRVTSRRQDQSNPTFEEIPPVLPRPRHQVSYSQDTTPPSTRQSAPTPDFRKAGTTADRLQALRERRRHVEKAASTSHLPGAFAGRDAQRPTPPLPPAPRRVALPSGPRG